jgi:ubiquinone/menaquinone biosynthesis C-methylase UbiE
MHQPSSERVARVFDKTAGKYDRQMGFWERVLFGHTRQWATAKATGEVLEIAVGTGVDISEGMLAIARQRASDLGLADRVELRQGDVQALDLPDSSVDTVVSTFTFCTIPDPLLAAREARRVLRPGGRFVLVEHGPSTRRGVLALMRAIERLTVRFGADHLTRDPVPYLVEAGFDVGEVARSKMGIVFRLVATKPA